MGRRRCRGTNTDIVARFVLRAERLLSKRGQLGLVTVNTVTEGATLRVGLVQVTEGSLTIRMARSAHSWPTKSASLQIVEFWASRTPPSRNSAASVDGEEVPAIGPDLIPYGRLRIRPHQLQENEGIVFLGSSIMGLGFNLTAEEKDVLLIEDPRNADVIQPFVIGKDLNQRPDCSASRWIINFRGWPLDQAERYPGPLEVVRRLVKPERESKRDKLMGEIWWRHWRHRPGLYSAIASLDHVLAISLVSDVVMPVRVPTGPVFAHRCAVFTLDDFASLAILDSDIHATWVIRYSSTLETRILYAPSDVFLTLPRPQPTSELETLGRQLDTIRRDLMLSRAWGLTEDLQQGPRPRQS